LDALRYLSRNSARNFINEKAGFRRLFSEKQWLLCRASFTLTCWDLVDDHTRRAKMWSRFDELELHGVRAFSAARKSVPGDQHHFHRKPVLGVNDSIDSAARYFLSCFVHDFPTYQPIDEQYSAHQLGFVV
jgi:hypothetical protein